MKTIDNAGRVLDLFGVDTPERGATEVAKLLDMPKSQAHALLVALTDCGLLQRTPWRRYRIGWRALALSRVLAETTEFRGPARQVMAQLTAHFGETVHLATLDGAGRVVYVERFEGTRAVRIAVSSVGSTLSPHCSGVGKALLAYLPDERLDTILETAELERFTEKTITDRDALRAELDEVREQGVAYDHEEAVPEVCCVAAPIFGYSSEATAALSITTPAYRFSEQHEHLRLAVVRGARAVTRHMRTA